METTTNNSTGVPDWMIGIKKGGYQFITKAQLKSQQQPGNPLKRQIWARGMLAAIGYKGELAVTTIRENHQEKRILLTAGHIGRDLHKIKLEYFRKNGIPEAELKKLKPHHRQTIRNAISGIEAEGMMERRHNGIPFKDMKQKEIQAIPNGEIEMYFWFEPKPPKPEIVREEWNLARDSGESLSVSQNDLPKKSILLITKALDIRDSPEFEYIANLQSAEHHTSILAELKEKAIEIIRHYMPVSPQALPEVSPQGLPEVRQTSMALEERCLERDVKRSGKGWLAGNSSIDTTPPVQQPHASQPARPTLEHPKELTQALVDRGFDPVSSILEKLRLALKDASVAEFLTFLDERRSRSAVGRGLLPAIAEEFMQARHAAQTVTPHPIPPTRTSSTIERAKELLKKRLEAKEQKYA